LEGLIFSVHSQLTTAHSQSQNLKKISNHINHYFSNLSVKAKIGWLACVLLAVWFWLSLPSKLFRSPTSFVITDASGNLLNASIAADGQWRFPYNDSVPEKFVKCITAFEDARFFYHPGIDPMAMGRAVWQDIRSGKVVSGGSTLTMQVIRLHKKNSKRNIVNKIAECILAVRLELGYKKSSILALYTSNTPFGSNVVGLDAAAWRYFGRNANQLSWGEMAALAVLPNAPSLVHPGKNTDLLLRKRNALLEKLWHNKTIDLTTYTLAKLEPLPGEPRALPQWAPHLLERFKKEYMSGKQKFSGTALQTTVQLPMQKQVNQVLWQSYQQQKGNQINNAAAMVMDIETGNILAYVGNVYKSGDTSLHEPHVDVLASARSPGSTLKPLLYASLLHEGTMLPRQLVADVPTQIAGYTPQNFDLGYDGAVPANRALSRSLNIPAVKMLQQYKSQRFYDLLKQCGFTTLGQPAEFYGMSLILGGCEISPFELAGVYSSAARMYQHQVKNKGKWNGTDWFMPKYFATQVTDQHTPAAPLFDYVSLWQMFNAMDEVMRPGEEGLWTLFSSAQRIAWKTGTSFGFRDGWAIGITSRYCVVVWVGNTTGEGRPGLTGINTAAPVMFDIFRLLPAAASLAPPTSGFVYLKECKYSGYKAGPDCGKTGLVLVNEAAKNTGLCPYCRKITLDATASLRVTENCLSPSDMRRESWFVLPPAMEFYYRQKHAGYRGLPPFAEGCSEETAKTMDILYPSDRAKIYVPLEISGGKGRAIFTATHRNPGEKLFWHLDNDFAGTTQEFHQLSLNPAIGQHIITVIDHQGNRVSRQFEILAKEK
jgi:penicillin-binding protein 1C